MTWPVCERPGAVTGLLVTLAATLAMEAWAGPGERPAETPLVVSYRGAAVPPKAPGSKPAVPGADLFNRPVVRGLALELAAKDLAALRAQPRHFVPAVLREGAAVYPNVGLHLKGSVGSFRGIDDRPSLTLDFARFAPAQRFHGLRRLHLNNSLEDPSCLNEFIGGELFRAAGVPAPRVAHARVELNGRALGLYVLKEGFTEDFLGLYFTNAPGNLYDIGPGHDVNEEMRKDLGRGPDDLSDLKALAAVALEPDPDQGWRRLEHVMDVDRFLSFMAMEIMAGHRDGYCLARNNFRIYHDLDTDKLLFLPHGMDQLFGEISLPWQPRMAGVVAQAVMATPQGRLRYRERFSRLLTNVFQPGPLGQRIDRRVAEMQPALSRSEGRTLREEAARIKGQIVQRHADLQQQLRMPGLELLQFNGGSALLTDWRGEAGDTAAVLDRNPAPDGQAALHIRARAETSAAWRARVRLPAGRYRFEGLVRTAGVVPLAYGQNKGAGLRVSGRPAAVPYRQTGDSPWTKATIEFEVVASNEVIEVVGELRASKGEAWFDVNSLRLTRLP